MQSSGLYAWFSGLLCIFQFQRQANKYSQLVSPLKYWRTRSIGIKRNLLKFTYLLIQSKYDYKIVMYAK